jgi:hypothetical protein
MCVLLSSVMFLVCCLCGHGYKAEETVVGARGAGLSLSQGKKVHTVRTCRLQIRNNLTSSAQSLYLRICLPSLQSSLFPVAHFLMHRGFQCQVPHASTPVSRRLLWSVLVSSKWILEDE